MGFIYFIDHGYVSKDALRVSTCKRSAFKGDETQAPNVFIGNFINVITSRNKKDQLSMDDFQTGYHVESAIYWTYATEVDEFLKNASIYTNRVEKLLIGLLFRSMCENDVSGSGKFIKRMAFPERTDESELNGIFSPKGNFGSEFINRFLNMAYNLHTVSNYELNDSFNHIFYWRPHEIMEFVKRIPKYTYKPEFRNSLRKGVTVDDVALYEKFCEKCFGKPDVDGKGVKSNLDWSLRLCPTVLSYVLAQNTGNIAFYDNITKVKAEQQALRDDIKQSKVILEKEMEAIEAKARYLEQLERTSSWLKDTPHGCTEDEAAGGAVGSGNDSFAEDTSDKRSLDDLDKDFPSEPPVLGNTDELKILEKLAEAEANLPVIGDPLSATSYSKNRHYNYESVLDIFVLMRNLSEHLKDCRPKQNDNRDESLKKIDSDIFDLFSSHKKKEKCVGHERSTKTTDELLFEYFALRFPTIFVETYVLAVNTRICVDKAGHYQQIKYKLEHTPAKLSNIFPDLPKTAHRSGQAVSDEDAKRLRKPLSKMK